MTSTQLNQFKKEQKNTVLGAVISFVVMTAVYMYLARDYPMHQRLKSSFGHSTFCFVMTFFAMTLMNFFYRFFQSKVSKYIASVTLSGTVALAMMGLWHLFLGTPDILETLIASVFLGAPMFLLYPLKLVKSDFS